MARLCCHILQANLAYNKMMQDESIGFVLFLRHNMELIIACVAVVVWLVRLEGKVSQVSDKNVETQKDVDTLRARHESLDSKIVEQLSQVREDLAEIKGYLRINKEEKL